MSLPGFFSLRRPSLLWRKRSAARNKNAFQLNRRRIYILPTRSGMLFGLLITAMLLGSINYSLNLGYLVTFFLASMAMLSIFHVYLNVSRLKLYAGAAPPVFAGADASFGICIDNAHHPARYAIGLGWNRHALAYADVAADASICVVLPARAARRGVLRPGKCLISSDFPLGLFRAYSNVDLDLHALVYPAPVAGKMPQAAAHDERKPAETVPSHEDFVGLRAYQPGDSPRHVAWKAAARGEGLLTKVFAANATALQWLDFDALPAADTETRLSLLTGMVLEADASASLYGMALPGMVIQPAHGLAHKTRCLRALALFGRNEAVS